MFNKKAIFILMVATLLVLVCGTTAIAQDTTFSGSSEFSLGIEAGYILNGEDDATNFNWGIHSSFDPKASIFFDFFAYTGDDQGYGAVEAGFEFQVHELGVKEGYARFYDFLGIDNHVEFNYDYDFDDLEGNLELVGMIGQDMMTIIFGIKDWLNEGIIDSGGNLNVDPGQSFDYAKSQIFGGVKNFNVGEILNIGAQLKLEFFNTMGVDLGDFFDETDAFDSNYRWKIIFDLDLGFTVPGEVGTVDFGYEFGYNEASVLSNNVDLDVLIDGIMENMEIRFALEADFKNAGGTTINYGEDTAIIDSADLTFGKLPIQFMASYTLDMGILITPSVYVYADISPLLNETEDDPLPDEYIFPLYAKLTVELGLGGDGLFTVPFYIALTSVPLNEDYSFNFDDVSDESNPPASDELLRLLFGIGVDIKF